MENKTQLETGATIWARKTITSDIFLKKPAEWFKIWFYIITKVNHSDNKIFKRGTGFFNFHLERDIVGCTEDQIKKCLKYLRRVDMILTQRSTRGNIITVLQYNLYQDLTNYRAPREAREKHEGSTPIHNNVNNVNTTNTSSRTTVPYGKEEVNFVLEEFKRNVGINPIDSNARNVAFNIYQLTSTFIKKQGTAYKVKRGEEATFTGLVTKAWEVYRKNNGDHLPQRLKTFKEHYKGMLEKLSISLTA